MAIWSCAGDDVRRSKRYIPIHIWTSENQNGEVSEGLSVYLPGRSKKKNANSIMLAIALVVGSVVFDATARMTMIGTGLTPLGGGSFLEYAFSIRSKLKLV